MNDNTVAESTTAGLHSRGLDNSGGHPEARLRTEGDIDQTVGPFFTRMDLTCKQAEDPPRNSQGKLICRFQDICPELAFDRKREWR
jgi:hypothetical protein